MVAKLLTVCGMIWRSLGQVVSGQRGWTAAAPRVKAITGADSTHQVCARVECSQQVPLFPAFSNLLISDTVFEPFLKSVRLNGKGFGN